MKTWPVAFAAGLAAGWILTAGSALPQEGGAPPGPPAGEAKKDPFKGADPREHDPAEMHRRMMESMAPNRFHERLAADIGDWDVEMTMFMEGPPTTSKWTSKVSWLFPGKWLKEEVRGSVMGMPFEGLLVRGYDNVKKKHVACWVDSMGTSLSFLEGNYARDGKTLLMFGTMNEPMTGEHDKAVKMVAREVSPDEAVAEMHDLSIGEANTKVWEMRYKRRK